MTGLSRDPLERQLARILNGRGFVSSPRMQSFLRFVIEKKLEDDVPSLKETSIGIAVFDRKPGYDPQVDAIVRVEARRLRSKLQQYYETEGLLDPVVIQLPTGTYVPEFLERPVAEIAPAAGEAVSIPQEHRSHRFWMFLTLWSAVLVVAASFGGWTWARVRMEQAAQPVSRPLTSYPGQEFDPQISPDGKQVAFVWDGNVEQYKIYTKLLEVGNPVRVTSGPGHDLHPSWSPDAQYLAFLRVAPSEKALMMVPALGGAVRKVADLTPSEVGTWRADATQMYGSPGPAWSPTGGYIAVTDYPDSGTGGALVLITPDGKRIRQLTRPPAGIHDFDPAFSPNGRLLAFIRYTSAYTSDLHLISVDGGEARQLTFDRHDIRGISWLPDNRTITFASNRGNGYGLWKTTKDGTAPIQVALNGYRMTEPSVGHGGELLAYTDTMRGSNGWRATRAGSSGKFGPPEMVIASSRQSFCAHYSPDGQRIAFVSDRSGNFEVWVSKSDGSEPVQITNFGGPMVGSPRWSPDGRWITFDARQDGHAAIFVVSSAGGTPHPLEKNRFEERMPSWSRNGKWIYFSSNRGGPVQLWKAPVSGGPAVRISHGIAFTSSESVDGKTIYFTGLGSGIWQVSSEGGEESLIPELGHFHAGLYVAVAKQGIYLVESETSRKILFFSFATRRVESVAKIAATMVIDTSSLDVSSDERQVLYSQMDAGGSDIMLARNWHLSR